MARIFGNAAASGSPRVITATKMLVAAMLGTLCLLSACSPADTPASGTDAAQSDGAPDGTTVNSDWLKGWHVAGKDAADVGNLTTVWSNGKAGAEREWLIGGGSVAGKREAVIWELHGDTWKKHTLPNVGILWWLHGDASGRRIAVGDGGHVVRWQSGDDTLTAGKISSLATAGAQLFGVWWGDGSDHFYIVGGNTNVTGAAAQGLVWRVPMTAATHEIDAKATRIKLAGDPGLIMKVWGVLEDGKEHVFAVGEDGVIYKGDKGGFALDAKVPGVDRFIGVSGRGSEDVIAVGGLGSGRVARRDKAGWRLVAGCTTCFINGQLAAVLLTADGTAVVGGSNGYLATQKEDSKVDLPLVDPPLSELDLHGAWYDGHTAVVVGGNLSNPSVAVGAVLFRGVAVPALPAGK